MPVYDRRTVRQVQEAQRSPRGCCAAYADYSPCDCLEKAKRRAQRQAKKTKEKGS